MKFKVGEIAELVALRRKNPHCLLRVGDDVEIVRVGPFKAGEKSSDGMGETPRPADYEVSEPSGMTWFAKEWQLRKKRPPEEPAEDSFQEELSQWLNKKEPVTNE